MERAKERRGKGTRDELLRPPSPFKKRCEKVYFVGRCVIRVITLTSLLPEEKREREGEGKSKKNTVRAAGAPKEERSTMVEPLLAANAGLLCIIKAMCRPGLLCRRPG